MSILGMNSKLIGATLLLGFAVQAFDEVLLPAFNHLTLVYQDGFNVINSTEVEATRLMFYPWSDYPVTVAM